MFCYATVMADKNNYKTILFTTFTQTQHFRLINTIFKKFNINFTSVNELQVQKLHIFNIEAF